ncbi:MAG TPA: gas vesicle protein [Longimicrobiaceae bacterium]|nr:gas vesicle protein [Longimicrobiaceae bacterium]
MPEFTPLTPTRPQGLVDILDRILDKGLVIAGDIKINLANVELLTVQVRLLVCSIDKAEQIGLNWWRFDPALTGTPGVASRADLENRELRERVRLLEERLERLAPGEAPAG